jgi:hypothetical protein
LVSAGFDQVDPREILAVYIHHRQIEVGHSLGRMIAGEVEGDEAAIAFGLSRGREFVPTLILKAAIPAP